MEGEPSMYHTNLGGEPATNFIPLHPELHSVMFDTKPQLHLQFLG